MSTVLNVKLPGKYPTPLATPPSPIQSVPLRRHSSAHLWNRAVKPAKTHAPWQRALRRTCRFDSSHTHTHTDVSTCEVLLSPSHSLTVCHSLSLSFFLFLTKGLSFKMAYKWNCWKIKNRSRHFVFHATRRLIIKTDFYMQRQFQRNVC